MELIMKYFVGVELGVANLLQRNFDWVANSLWFEEIPNARDPSKTFFVLGGKDSILHSHVRCCVCQWHRAARLTITLPLSA